MDQIKTYFEKFFPDYYIQIIESNNVYNVHIHKTIEQRRVYKTTEKMWKDRVMEDLIYSNKRIEALSMIKKILKNEDINLVKYNINPDIEHNPTFSATFIIRKGKKNTYKYIKQVNEFRKPKNNI